MGKSNARVIYERIKPDVSDKVFVEGQGNSPVQTRQRTRDAQIFEFIVFKKAENFVAPIVRLDERRIFFDEFNQPLLMFAQLEPVIRFLELDDFAVSRVKAAIGQ